jgi:hypothetical protein
VLKTNGELHYHTSWGGDTWTPDYTLQEKAGGHRWEPMSDGRVLLLDHRVRTIKEKELWGTYLDPDNYIAVGSKGAGCSKRLTDLSKQHGLYQKRTR